jgi:hypothetical protein
MSARSKDDAEAQEGFVRGFHDIPDPEKLNAMSFAELSSLLSSCAKDSAKFLVVERELKKHLAKDQAKINLPNMLWAACIGGVFALAGVVLGAYLKNSPPFERVAPSAAAQHIEKSDLGVKPPLGQVAPSQPPIVQPSIQPAPAQNNEQSRKSAP